MSDATRPRGDGPVEAGPWPDRLAARALSLGGSPRLRGYDVQRDLAKHYSLVEVVWLALLGELPASPREAALLERVLLFLAPVTVAEAPAHAAALAQHCRSSAAAVIGIAGLTLAQEGLWVVEAHADLIGWARGQIAEFPEAFRRPEEAAAVARLAACLAALDHRGPVFAERPGLVGACLATLVELGFDQPTHLVTLWGWARLPCALAEGFAAPAGRLSTYPMDLPRFVYEDPDDTCPK